MFYERLKEEAQVRFKDLHMKIGAVIVGLILLSLLFYVIRPEKKATRILFYPKTNYSATTKRPVLQSEQRALPELSTKEENIRLLVQELLLGPRHPELTGFCLKDTKLVRLFIKDNNLYLDFSGELLEATATKQQITMQDKLEILRKNILFNFHGVKKIHIFLNGQIPQF